MKKAILFAALSILGNTELLAQNSSTSIIGLYSWCDEIQMQPCDEQGVALKSGTESTSKDKVPIGSIPGQKFRVIKALDNGYALIKILDYTSSVTNKKVTTLTPKNGFYKYNFKGKETDYNKLDPKSKEERIYDEFQAYFKVEIKYINENAISERRIKGSLAVGVINYPFKYRIQKGYNDFSGAFNFGAGIGFTLPHKEWRECTISFISGYSISSISLDSSNTAKNQDKLSSTNNFSAFSFSVGSLFQYRNAQVGIFFGMDRLNKINQEQYNWRYQGKTWISVGFGLAIFSRQETKVEKNSKMHQ